MPKLNAEEIIKDHEHLWSQNANARSFAQELADYFIPRKAWITSIRTQGERTKFNFLYNSTGIQARRTTAAGFHNNLVDPTTRWFGLETKNKDLMRRNDVRQYFHEVENILFSALDLSNFYNVFLEWAGDFVTFQRSTMLMLSDPEDDIVFRQMPVGNVTVLLDHNDRLTTVYWKYKLTARQAFNQWREDAGPAIVKAITEKGGQKQFEHFEFLHYVTKRADRDATKSDAINMPYLSAHINIKDKKIIEESGFPEMPYFSDCFFKDPEDPNGFSPAMDVLADVKLVNAMERTTIRGAMKITDPPLVSPSSGFVLPLNLNPAAMNYYNKATNNPDDLKAMPVGQGRVDISVDLIKMVEERIERGMFVPLFRSLQNITKQMTIPEVQRRVSESMGLLAPVVGRVNYNILGPIVTRLYNVKARRGQLPPPPDVLFEPGNDEFVVNYLSRLANAQRHTEAAEIEAFLADVQAVGSIIPAAFDKIDEDKTIEVLHRVRRVTPELLREDDDLQELREARAQQQQALAELQMGGAVADIAKTGSEANKNLVEAEK